MARVLDAGLARDRIDFVAERWRAECLERDGSLLFDDRAVWTEANLREFYRRFVDEALQGPDTFIDKLRAQLADAPVDVRWLAVELVAVYLLIVHRMIKPAGKLKLVEDVAGSSLATRPPHWDELVEAFQQGIAHPGTGYNARRDAQIEYLVDFGLRLKQLDAERRRALLNDPWALRDFADDTSAPLREMRHVVLHLLRPDDFERISSGKHKQRIVDAFADEAAQVGVDLPGDLDERLLAIRRWLIETTDPEDGALDFYFSPFVERWHPRYDEVTRRRKPDEDNDAQDVGAPERCFILSQLQIDPAAVPSDRAYGDVEGERYHWREKASGNTKVLSQSPGARFAYYRPRKADDGTAQRYFGAGRIEAVDDLGPNEDGERHWVARLIDYRRFDEFVGLHDGPKRNAQTSIELVGKHDFEQLLRRGYRDGTGSLSVEAVRGAARARGLLLPDEIYARVVAAINSDKHIILTGPPGTAKTTLAQTVGLVAKELGLCQGFMLTTATADWTTYETIGGLRPQENQSLEFEEGHFLKAIRSNEWLVIDELNRSNFDRAFGQLFTVLSGQAVVLPYTRPGSDRPLVVIPPDAMSPIPEPDPLHLPRSWRVIATMNVFDKSLLFEMSYALMRRFAFIEVPSPDADTFETLIGGAAAPDPHAAEVASSLLPLRDLRDIGPAVFLDIARYCRERRSAAPVDDAALRFECFYSYLLPQFEGVTDDEGTALFDKLRPLVGDGLRAQLRKTLQTVLGVELAVDFGGADPP
jgi:MoxR-like ATPase